MRFVLYGKCCVYWDIFFLTGTCIGTIVRPKVHYTRPPHPPPDPPIQEPCVTGFSDQRASLFTPNCQSQADLENTKLRRSYPDRLVRSRSTDTCTGRRPSSDPCINRRTVVEDKDQAGTFSSVLSASASKDSLKVEVCMFLHVHMSLTIYKKKIMLGCLLFVLFLAVVSYIVLR